MAILEHSIIACVHNGADKTRRATRCQPHDMHAEGKNTEKDKRSVVQEQHLHRIKIDVRVVVRFARHLTINIPVTRIMHIFAHVHADVHSVHCDTE